MFGTKQYSAPNYSGTRLFQHQTMSSAKLCLVPNYSGTRLFQHHTMISAKHYLVPNYSGTRLFQHQTMISAKLYLVFRLNTGQKMAIFYPSNGFGFKFHVSFLFKPKFYMKSHNAHPKLSYFITQCPKKCFKILFTCRTESLKIP
jgi:hypothetical protein